MSQLIDLELNTIEALLDKWKVQAESNFLVRHQAYGAYKTLNAIGEHELAARAYIIYCPESWKDQ